MNVLLKKTSPLLLACIVLILSVFAWKGVLIQTIEGEGFYYFSPTNGLFPHGNLINLFTEYDNFPRAFTYFLEIFLKGNIAAYMVVLLITILLVNLFYFILIKKITNNSITAFTAALLFGVNFASNFQVYGRGHFQWYLQRVCELLVIFPGVFFLTKFIKSNKTNYYFLSLLFFAISLFMTQFTSFFAPLFASLLFVSALSYRKNMKKAIFHVLLIIPFLLLTYLAVEVSALSPTILRPHQTFIQFLVEEAPGIIDKINYQLVVVTIPFAVISPALGKIKDLSTLVRLAIVPTYVFYLATLFYLYKQKLKYFNVLISCFLALLGVLFLTVYVNRTNLYGEILQGRYFYVPSILVAFIVGSLITTIISRFRNRNIIVKSIVYLTFASILIAWYGRNYLLINNLMDSSQKYYTQTSKMLELLSEKKNNFPDKAILFIPNPPLPGGEDFIKKYYSRPGFTILYLDTNWQKKIPEGTDLNNVFFYEYQSIPLPRSENEIKVLDISDKYRRIYSESLSKITKP